ncbi:MAG: MarR family winged helix-turn-helix transcriptional regulator [Polyangiales bacterium]
MTEAPEFASLLRRVARGVLRLERDLVCCGITLQQFEALREIEEAGVLQTTEVAARLSIDVSTASRNLKLLERDGYVKRVRIEGDGRRVGNRLTANGRRRISSLACGEQVVFDEVLAKVPVGERASVLRVLARLAGALEPATSSECCATGCANDAAPRARTSMPSRCS